MHNSIIVHIKNIFSVFIVHNLLMSNFDLQLHPHIIHYGKVDSMTNTLKFPLSRPCLIGEQCCLSYGNFSSSHLITFYGFIPQGDNPYDVIPLGNFQLYHLGLGTLERKSSLVPRYSWHVFRVLLHPQVNLQTSSTCTMFVHVYACVYILTDNL